MDLKTYIQESPRGTAARLAEFMEIAPSYLTQMASGQAPISPARAVEIEIGTNGAVTRKDTHKSDWQLIWPELAEKPLVVQRKRRHSDHS
jgi:DNA-binding transcriptional regulator YdaS (Cro superfamily)